MTTKIAVRTGTEGPKEDPWSWTEREFERGGHRYVLRQGLDFWLEVDGARSRPYVSGDGPEDEGAVRRFERLTGMPLARFDRYADRIGNPRRCPKCAGRRMAWRDGYPGESIRLCRDCGEVVAHEFNLAEVA